MILDAHLLLSDAQAVSSSAASTNYVNLTGASNKIFDGEPMAVVVNVDVAADGTTTDETYAFAIQCDDNTGFSSATTLVSQTLAYGVLTAGSQHVLPIPVGAAVEKYMRLYYTLGGTTPSVTVTAYLQPLSMVQKYTTYADGITIS